MKNKFLVLALVAMLLISTACTAASPSPSASLDSEQSSIENDIINVGASETNKTETDKNEADNANNTVQDDNIVEDNTAVPSDDEDESDWGLPPPKPQGFSIYEDYLLFIKEMDLPENFVHASNFANIGEFVYAVFGIEHDIERDMILTGNYTYSFQVENNTRINISISPDAKKPISNTADVYLVSSIDVDPSRVYVYDKLYFNGDDLTVCNIDEPWSYVIINNITYKYYYGKLYSISFHDGELSYEIEYCVRNDEYAYDFTQWDMRNEKHPITSLLKLSTMDKFVKAFDPRGADNTK